MIDQATKQKILDAAQIVEVVSDFVNLKKAGVNFKGICPFHDDKSPSLVVSPAKGVYKCFACGAGGGVVKFVMEHEQMTYTEALKWLANKYHIEVHERELTDQEKQDQSDKESMMVVSEWACQYFEDTLKNTVDGRAIGLTYFRSRGFRDDIISKFRLGYSLSDRYALTQAAKAKGYKEEFLTGSGVCYKLDDGRLHDRFYGRVIFPFFTISGRIVGFGGRVLDARTKGVNQKYVNSPESPIYDKSRNLYGLYQAKQSIVRENRCFIVEGYTDVLSMFQSGVENVVASSGTALTTGQIKLLHRFTSNITLLYDGDDAGLKASERGVDLLLQEGMNVKILVLPKDEDPDSFCKHHSATEVKQYLQDHQVDFIRFRMERMLEQIAGDPIRKSELIKTVVNSIALIPDEISRSVYIHESAQQLNVDERMLLKEVAQNRKKAREDKDKYKSEGKPTTGPQPEGENMPPLPTPLPEEEVPSQAITYTANPFYDTETLIIRELILYGEQICAEGEDENGNKVEVNVADYIYLCMQQDGIVFHTLLYNKVLEDVRTLLQTDPKASVCAYLLGHPDTNISNLASQLAVERYTISKIYGPKDEETTSKTKNKQDDEAVTRQEMENRLQHLINDLKLRIINAELKDMQKKLLDPSIRENAEQQNSIQKTIMELIQLKKLLAKETGDRVVTI